MCDDYLCLDRPRCVCTKGSVGYLITYCLIDSFQNKMFSAIQDGEWLEDDQVNDGWDQDNVVEAP